MVFSSFISLLSTTYQSSTVLALVGQQLLSTYHGTHQPPDTVSPRYLSTHGHSQPLYQSVTVLLLTTLPKHPPPDTVSHCTKASPS